MMNSRLTRRRIVGLAGAAGVNLPFWLRSAAAATYFDFAMGLNRQLPDGTQFRPDLERELAALASSYREQEGKPALAADETFLAVARAHAADMMIHNFMGHRASTGHDLDSRVRAFVDDITRYPTLAENAARDSQKTPVDARKARALFQQWVKSRSHRKALRSLDYAYVSTGVVQRGTTIWAVQIYWGQPRSKGLFQ